MCVGPHADYQLRGPQGGAGRYVELPEWWMWVPEVEEAVDEGPDTRVGVTASGTPWRVRYDPTERQRQERQAKAETQRVGERARDYLRLLALAEEFGMELRPKVMTGVPVAVRRAVRA